MAKDVRIYLDDEELDTFDELDLSVTYSVADISEPFSGKSSVTKTFKLPATGRNKILFGFSEDINSTDGIDQTQQKVCRAEVFGSKVIEGFLKITKAVTRETTSYECVILSGNGDWLSRISDLNVRDLDYSDRNHIYNKANIDLSETTNGTDGTLEDAFIVYPLINYGDFQGNGVVTLTPQDVIVEQRLPSFQIRDIFLKIFNDKGFKITSSFLDSTFFRRLYLPFTGKSPLVSDDDINSRRFRAGLSTDQTVAVTYQGASNDAVPFNQAIAVGDFDNDSIGGNFDNGSNYSTVTKSYTVPNDGYYNFFLTINYDIDLSTSASASERDDAVPNNTTAPASELTVKARIVKGATTLKQHSRVYTTTSLPTVINTTESITDQAISIQANGLQLSAGDVIGVVFEQQGQLDYIFTSTVGGSNTPIPVDSDLVIKSDAVFYNSPVQSRLLRGDTVDVSQTLLDTPQTEYLKGIKQLFNLQFYTFEETREIFIEPWDDFVTGNIIDWTGKEDLSRPIEVSFLGDTLSSILRYRYKDDSKDGHVEKINEQIGKPLASQDKDIDNKFAKVGTGDNANPVFAPTLMDRAEQIGFRTDLLPKLWQEFRKDTDPPTFIFDFAPRILYYNGVRPMQTGDSWSWEGTTRTDYPEMYSVKTDSDNDNLLYFDDTSISSGLFEKYYRNLHKTINESRLLTIWMNLNPADIATLDFRNPIQLTLNGETAVYRLNKVKNYDPLSDRPTEVELLKIVANVPKATVTTIADGGSILPPIGDASDNEDDPIGIVATINGITVPVIVEDDDGNLLQVFKADNDVIETD